MACEMADELLYPVRVLHTGTWLPDDILIFERPFVPFPAQVKQKVECRWMLAEVMAQRQGVVMTRGTVRAGSSLYVKNDKLCLKYGTSDYGNAIGSTHPDVPEYHQHRFVGFMCVTCTSDGFLVYGVRGAIDWPYQCHVAPAGRWSTKQESPVAGIKAEFKEELGVHPDEILDLQCIAVIADDTIGRMNFEFVFTANVLLTFTELRQRAFSAKSKSEHVQLLPVGIEDVETLIMSAPYKWVPTGFAGMALRSRRSTNSASVVDWTSVADMTYESFMTKAMGQ